MPVTWGDATSMMNRSWSGRRNGRHMLQSWPASSRHFWVAGSHLTMRPTGGTPPLGGSGSCVSRVIPGGDRKSTRLNSSHITISYAVFCLKKKKKKKKHNEL